MAIRSEYIRIFISFFVLSLLLFQNGQHKHKTNVCMLLLLFSIRIKIFALWLAIICLMMPIVELYIWTGAGVVLGGKKCIIFFSFRFVSLFVFHFNQLWFRFLFLFWSLISFWFYFIYDSCRRRHRSRSLLFYMMNHIMSVCIL